MSFTRRTLLTAGAGLAAAALAPAVRAGVLPKAPVPLELEEATVDGLQARMADGALTAVGLVTAYLARIEALDRQGPALHAVLETNPDALAIARDLDAERKAGRVRGPLHGIPVLLKDNIDTHDKLQTTAGSQALVGAPVPGDAHIVDKLRAAGAIVLGKANLSEWANMRSSHSVSGWSARGGVVKNPYDLARSACGSSSGSGVAVSANLVMLAVGTETLGSIQCPAAINGVVGIKPTIGLVSRTGIIPISHTLDTAGPMARTVKDAATLLAVLAGPDPRDPATAASAAIDIDKVTLPGALRGARLGISRYTWPKHPDARRVMDSCAGLLKAEGAELIDVEIDDGSTYIGHALKVASYELKANMAKYLGARGGPMRSLTDLIAFNARHPEELVLFGQEHFLDAEARGDLTTTEYRLSLRALELARKELKELFDSHRLDAMFEPTAGVAPLVDLVQGDVWGEAVGSSLPTIGLGPVVTVPGGFMKGLPYGVSFEGLPGSDTRVLRLAWCFEQAAQRRQPPRLTAVVAR